MDSDNIASFLSLSLRPIDTLLAALASNICTSALGILLSARYGEIILVLPGASKRGH